MLDRSSFWPVPPVEGACLTGDGITIRLLPPMSQVMVSGGLEAFCAAHDLPPAVGLLAPVQAPRYALRLARNRMLAVGVGVDHATAGWADGIATTPMTGALAVIDIAGPQAMEIYARATAVDPNGNSASAALLFAGVTGALCRIDDGLRLHVDRGLTAYLFDWFAATRLVR